MTKKLILCAPLALVLSSCSLTRMGDVVPESRDTEYGDIAIHGFNTGSVITYGKNYKTGYMETAGVTVYHDSGIDNATKIAHAAGSVALGTGSVLQGVGQYKYGQAWESLATGGTLDIVNHHFGIPENSVNVDNSTSVAVKGSRANANARGGAGGSATSTSSASSSAKADANINFPKPGGGKPPHGGKPMPNPKKYH